MTDELETMKNLLRDAPVAVDENAKKRAINSALAAFDEKNAKARQGTGWLGRLMGTTNPMRRFSMQRTYVIAGSACALLLTVGLLSTTHLSKLPPEAYTTVRDVSTLPSKGATISQGAQPEADAELADSSVAAPAPTAPPMIAYEAKKEKGVIDSRGIGMAGGSAMLAKSSPEMSQARVAGNIASFAPPSPPVDVTQSYYHDEGRDKFADIKTNPTKVVKEEPVSTFSIDVDTASYSFVRGSLNNNVLPQKDAVRIEEMVNYFPYDYAKPTSKSEPFRANVSVSDTPWNKGTKLMHIGIKGYDMQQSKPHANLVFLLDTSGSMNEPNKLPLLQNSLKLMLDSLNPSDTISIVTYAGSAGVVLEPTKAQEKAKIIAAIDNLMAGGSTAGAEGIRTAYQLAEQNFDKNGVNRIMLATDGDFNVGITDEGELKSFIERKRESGIFLSVLGFGRGNYNDALMQTLAQNGNGNAAYIDNLNEARKALVEESTSTLFPIAKDVKIQVEFNPAKVAEYKLIGYETRMLNREDFNNDKVDAGDIGSGHTVTALYEITPVGSDATLVDDLRYAKDAAKQAPVKDDEYAFVKIRYKLPEESTSKLITTPVDDSAEVELKGEAAFATSVAAFGQLLRGDLTSKQFSYDDVVKLAESSKGNDRFGYRAEFINLVRLAKNAPALENGSPQPGPVHPPIVVY